MLDSLRVKVKDNNIFVHAIPLACEDFSPKFLGKTHEKWKWRIKIVDRYLRTEVRHQLARPIERKQKRQQSLHDDSVHPDVVVDQDNFALVDNANENLYEELGFDSHEQIIEIKVFKFETFQS